MLSTVSNIPLGLLGGLTSFIANNPVPSGLAGGAALVGGFLARTVLKNVVGRILWWTVDKSAKRLRVLLETYVLNYSGRDAHHHRAGVWFARRMLVVLDCYIAEAIKRLEQLEELLDRQGFERLTEENLTQEENEPLRCWRRPFSFTEISEGYAVDRERVTQEDDDGEGERVDLTEKLVSELQKGRAEVVLGRPGSGKTVILKSVAVRWQENGLGPVLYRKSGRLVAGDHGEVSTEEMKTAIELTKAMAGTTLVVVEDVLRSPTREMLAVLGEFWNDDDVAFLFDSRQREWEGREDALDTVVGMPASSRRRELLSRVEEHVDEKRTPPLDRPEVVRFARRFEEVTGETLSYGAVDEEQPTDERLEEFATEVLRDIVVEQGELFPIEDEEALEQIEEEADLDVDDEEDLDERRRETYEQIASRLDVSLPGSVLLLMYHFPIEGEDTGRAEGVSDESDHHGTTTLRGNVREVLRTVDNRADQNSDDVAGELLQATALLANVLNGTEIGVHKELLYSLGWPGERDERPSEDFDVIEQYAEDLLDGQVLFGQMDEGTRYWSHHALWSKLYLEEFIDHYEDDTWDTARQWFERAVSALFAVPDDAERREAIQKQLGGPVGPFQQMDDHPTEYADYFVKTVFDLGMDRPPVAPLFATTEYSGIKLPDVASGEWKAVVAQWRFVMYSNLGQYPKAERELDTFGSRIDEYCPDNESIRAAYYGCRGNLLRLQSNYDAAREQFETALPLHRSADDEVGEAAALNNLGEVKRMQGDYVAAREYYEGSLTIKRKLGDRRGKAGPLNNLGIVAQEQSDYAAARDYYEDSLAIHRELGDRRGEAQTLNNLGVVAEKQSDYDDAREYHEAGLAITSELGDRRGEAQILNNLGVVAGKQSDYDAAREYFEESLAIKSELDDRRGAASTLNNLGRVAQEQSDYDAAQDYYENGLAISTDIGALSLSIQILDNLVRVCAKQGDVEAAIEYCNRAIQTIDQSWIPTLEDQRWTFEQLRTELQTVEEDPDDLYELALGRVLANKRETAMQRFHSVWDQREDVDKTDEGFASVLAGGVLFAAHLALFGTDEDKEGDEDSIPSPEDVLGEVKPHADELPTPVRMLYEYLDEGETDTELEDLTEGIDADVEDSDDLDRGDKQALAVARLLSELQSQAELEELSTEGCYTQALYAMGNDDTSYAIRLLREAWSRRDDIAKDTGEYASVLAAGTLLAAHDPLVEQEIAPSDILDAIEPHESRLSEPMAAVFRQLLDYAADVTPDELREEVNEDAEELDVDDLEAVVCAALLERLTVDPEDVEEALAEMPVDECYGRALSTIGEQEIRGANALLREAWSRHDDTPEDDEAYPTVLAAGTLLAAHDVLFDLDVNGTEILETIEPHRNRLSEPVEAVFQQLRKDDTDVTPDELRETVDEDAEEFDLHDLETLIFAEALAALQDDIEASNGEDQSVPPESDAGDTEPTADLDDITTDLREDYRRGLTAIHDENQAEAIDALFDTWDHNDDLPTDADAFPTAVAAGVAMVTLDNDTLVDAIRTEILETAADHRSRLTTPVTAVLATLDDTDPETTADDLLADADLDGDESPDDVDDLDFDDVDVDDLDLENLETLAFARLLSRAEA